MVKPACSWRSSTAAAASSTWVRLRLGRWVRGVRLGGGGHVVDLPHRITMRPAGGLPMFVERR
ncbi:hypothetical protein ACO2Q3_04145 [Caulobacter sp. KR2-114]|uniref:hypothetical protein n=1 Tax=Caulobacter sp. KR2-114 TaxID=3400912 RepID=UPI003C044D5A